MESGVWEKDKSRIQYPEYLISSQVPIDDIYGVLYNGKVYSITDFMKTFRRDNTR
jgi:hypothetical protein